METHGPFSSYREALIDAIERRNANPVFGDGEAPDHVKEEWRTVGPPYCSGTLLLFDFIHSLSTHDHHHLIFICNLS